MLNQSKIGITLFIEMCPQRFLLLHETLGGWQYYYYFYLCYNWITPTLCNDINISSCVDYVLVYDAKSKAIFFKL